MNDFDLQGKIVEMSTNIKLILSNQQDHEDRIRVLEQKPVRRWDALITGIISAVIGVVIGILINGGCGKMTKDNWKEFLSAAAIRAMRTFAQAAIGMITVGSAFADVNWLQVLSVSGVSLFCRS